MALSSSQGKEEIIDKSGSCAVVVLIVDDMCYVSNLGDSRAIMSCKKGTSVQALTKDHKPYDEYEYNRIIEAGGKIYQTKIQQGVSQVKLNGQ